MITNFVQHAPFSAEAIKERTPYVRGLEITKETARYKFGADPMAEYLHTLGLDGADEDTGSVEWDCFLMRFGKLLLWEDDRGNVWMDRCISDDMAKEAFANYDAAYSAWLDQDDDEPEDDESEGPWCEIHNRPHEPGNFICELVTAETMTLTDED